MGTFNYSFCTRNNTVGEIIIYYTVRQLPIHNLGSNKLVILRINLIL